MNCKTCGKELTKGMPVTSNEKGICHLHCANGVKESHDELLHKLLAFSEEKQKEIDNSNKSTEYQLGYEKFLEDLNDVLQNTLFNEVWE